MSTASSEQGQSSTGPRPITRAEEGRAPEGDRAQRVRDALLLALASNPVSVNALGDAAERGALGAVDVEELLRALWSIGAVSMDGPVARWCLSDGPPDGFEWRLGAGGDYTLLYPVECERGSAGFIAAAYPNGSWSVRRVDIVIARGYASPADLPSAQAAALAAARRAGLFAPRPSPAAEPCGKHDAATGSAIGWQSWCPGCNTALHREAAPDPAVAVASLIVGLDLHAPATEDYMAALARRDAVAVRLAAWGAAVEERAFQRAVRGRRAIEQVCSFCGKGRSAVKVLVAAAPHSAAICRECVELCGDIVSGHADSMASSEASPYRETLTEQAERVAHGVADAAAGDAPALRQALAMTQASLREAREALALESRRADINADAAERERAMVDELTPVADAAERFCRALDATKIGRLSTDACDELDAATKALRALFAAPDGTVRP